MYIVYATRGEYSDYSLQDVYIGDVHCSKILDPMVKALSDCRWQTWEEMQRWDPHKEDEALRASIQGRAVEELERAGYRKVEAEEVWLG